MLTVILLKAEFPPLMDAVFKLLAVRLTAASVSTKQLAVDTKFVNVEDVLIVSRTDRLDRVKFEATKTVPVAWFSPMYKTPLRVVIELVAPVIISLNPMDVGPKIVETLMEAVPTVVVTVENEMIVLTCEIPGAFVPPY